MITDAIKHSIESIASTIVNAVERTERRARDTLSVASATVKVDGLDRHKASVAAGPFRRDARGKTEALALARLLLDLEDELHDRVHAGRERLENESETCAAARALLRGDAARKAG